MVEQYSQILPTSMFESGKVLERFYVCLGEHITIVREYRNELIL